MKKKLKPFIIGMVLILLVGIVTAAVLIRSATSEIDKVSGLHQMDTMRRHVLDSFWSIYKTVLDAEKGRGQDINAIIESVGHIKRSTATCNECHSADLVVEKVAELDARMDQFQEALSFFITTSANANRVDKLGIEAIQRGSDVLSLVEELSNLSATQMQRSVETMLRRVYYASYVFYATLTILCAFGIYLATMLVRSITRPVNALIDSTRMIADGKLGYRVEGLEEDEFGLLAANFNSMSEELRKSYTELGESNSRLKVEIAEHEKAERERQKLLEELIQARKLEAVGTLAGGIAHEFNNLLQSIQVSAEFMALSGASNEKHRKHLGVILNASARGADLTKRLLTFSRNIENEMRPMNLTGALTQVWITLKDTMPNNIDFRLANEQRALWIVGDVAAIDQILLNLVLNASDAMKNGGSITLTLSLCGEEELPAGVEIRREQGVALIQISDTGHGMDEETRSKIFEPFFTTKAVGIGTGLGLAISYGVVKSHGGQIECLSAPGRGTTFRIWLPLISPLKS